MLDWFFNPQRTWLFRWWRKTFPPAPREDKTIYHDVETVDGYYHWTVRKENK